MEFHPLFLMPMFTLGVAMSVAFYQARAAERPQRVRVTERRRDRV